MKKVLTFGVFDYFHLGHLRLFEQCLCYGDYLIVGIQNDEYILTNKPEAQVLYNVNERVELVSSLKIVNEVVRYDYLDPKVLETICFDVLALGEDHKGLRFDQLVDWCNTHNKEVVRMKRTTGISSTDIKKRIARDI